MFSKSQTSPSHIQSPFQSREASWSSGGHANFLIGYLLWQNLTVNRRISAMKILVPQSLPWWPPADCPLTKKPEDEIGPTSCYTRQKHFVETDGHFPKMFCTKRGIAVVVQQCH